MTLADLISEGLHLNNFQELHLIHELLEREGPTLPEGLEVFGLFDVKVNGLKGLEGF